MDDEDYRELLWFPRAQIRRLNLGAVDERIMSNMRGSEGVLWDLTFDLKHLLEEIQPGSDAEYSEPFRRIGRHVQISFAQICSGVLAVRVFVLRDRVHVEYRRDEGSIAGDHVQLIDFDNPAANERLAPFMRAPVAA
jgi:hypothetical protein